MIDADPDARKGQNEVTVKLASIAEPTAPPEANGLPFRPVFFEGLSVTPYVKETGGRPRVAYSLRAAEMKPAPKSRGGEYWPIRAPSFASTGQGRRPGAALERGRVVSR